jgi:mono/diheme cytochrome c family protein
MQLSNPKTLAGVAVSLLGLSLPSLSAAAALFPASAERGQAVYAKACAACHGENGDGNGPGAGPLNPKPRDFTSGMYKYRSTNYGEMPTDTDLLRVVNDGVAHTQMPPWKNTLSEQERLDVVAYIKMFSADFKDAHPETIEIPEPPPSSPEYVKEGRKVFMTLQCWNCHGTSGHADGPAASGLMDSWGHSIRPVNFTWEHYKHGNDPKSIYKTFNTGLNGTPMISFAGSFLFGGNQAIDSATNASFSKAEVAELQAYLQSQPSDADINAMSDEKKKELEQRRKWALVHYLRSLIQKPNAAGWIQEDMELTR